MKAYVAFTGKEFTEFIRTYKLLIIVLVFLLFGISSPLAAKYMPELISHFMPAGMKITIAEPKALDSWMQFSKNVSQMGMFVIVILFSGMMSGEYSKGTLIHILTKGLPRRTVILAKFTAASLLWTGTYLLCFGTAYGYTLFYWRSDANIAGLGEMAAAIWLFGIFLTAVNILGSVMINNSYGCLFFTGLLVVLLMLLNMIPKVKQYNPIQLVSGSALLISGQLKGGELMKPMAVTAVFVIICILAACAVFNKKRL